MELGIRAKSPIPLPANQTQGFVFGGSAVSWGSEFRRFVLTDAPNKYKARGLSLRKWRVPCKWSIRRGAPYTRVFYGGLNGMVAVGGPKGANTHI